ncbi:N-acetylglucosamine-6-phosphate deacetylase [Lichenihabitans psoromatis]|uniref:N-acetylglucosamine-6-phosphate deacetylase n=1 Tax=Lichenihabitans psoromatis TaxID=2528642 RepID=UPI001036982B|nr:N-acetylglucosamine-6-phosphate deacetylase [Lichenihabitans psoromatis]
MKEVLFGARIFDGNRFWDDHALVHENGTILGLVPSEARPGAARSIDLNGGILAPGLVDIQNNGGGGVLFNDNPTPEGVAAIAAAHRRFGTTSLLPTVITDRPAVLRAALDAVRASVGTVPGCLGIHVEGPFIDPRRAGAHPPAFIRAMTAADADALIAARVGVMLVTVAPASADAALFRRLVEAGIVVSLGHAEATAAEAQAGFAAGATAATHLFNAMSPLGHRAPGLVGAALASPAIICGLIADGFHVADAALRVAVLAKGAPGIALISDAMPPSAGGPDSFMLGGRLATRRDGRLELDDGTLAGAAITLLDAVAYLTNTLQFPLETALQMATATPARLLGLQATHGRLGAGAVADMIHTDDNAALHAVWVAGLSQPTESNPQY